MVQSILRRPDTIITRMIRGMLPRKKPSGITAHKRLKSIYRSSKATKIFEKIQFDKAKIKKSTANYTTYGRTWKNSRVDRMKVQN